MISAATVLKSLLLIRLDAIGDYILFRNFIKILTESNQYKTYKITLLGNRAWKSIAEEFDSELISEFIWLDIIKFNNRPDYHSKKLKKITSKRYDEVISPVYSRYFYIDNIVKKITSNNKIGSIGNLSNIISEDKQIGDQYYTKLIPAKSGNIFEFYRNKEFFEILLKTELAIKKPSITLEKNQQKIKLNKKYAVLFIGASSGYRKWGIENFVKIAKFLSKKYDYKIVLCGSSNDTKNAKLFYKSYKNNYVDLVNKISLVDLFYILDKGSILVSNETAIPHCAMAIEMKNIFVIYNGSHYERFTPYPKEIANQYNIIVHPKIKKDLKNYSKISNAQRYKNYLNINKIKSSHVIKSIVKNINNTDSTTTY